MTEQHLCLVLEYAEKGSLTGYVADRWQHGQKYGVFLTEDEARYFFIVSELSVPYRRVIPLSFYASFLT